MCFDNNAVLLSVTEPETAEHFNRMRFDEIWLLGRGQFVVSQCVLDWCHPRSGPCGFGWVGWSATEINKRGHLAPRWLSQLFKFDSDLTWSQVTVG